VGLIAPQKQTPHVTGTLCDTTTRSSPKINEYEPLSMMAVSCPVCARSFTSEAALQAHTGTTDPTLRKAQVCTTCKQRFCSQRTIAQHRLSTSHPLPSCVICKKEFRSEKASADHKQAKHTHKPVEEKALPSAPKVKKVSPINRTPKFRSVSKVANEKAASYTQDVLDSSLSWRLWRRLQL
jgi:hypothetical protein